MCRDSTSVADGLCPYRTRTAPVPEVARRRDSKSAVAQLCSEEFKSTSRCAVVRRHGTIRLCRATEPI